MILRKYYVVLCIQHNLISKAYKVLQFFDAALLASSIHGTLRKNIIIFTTWETLKSNKLRLVEGRSMIYRFVWTFLWASDHDFSKSAIKADVWPSAVNFNSASQTNFIPCTCMCLNPYQNKISREIKTFRNVLTL